MRVTVTTPTGHIGSVVAARLLDANAEIVLPVRNPEKVAGLAERGAKVMKGTLGDAACLTEACRGVDALFWLTPPDLAAPDCLAHYTAMGRSAATAVKESGITQVVNLSSIGAHLKEGTGPIKCLHPIEKMFEEVSPNVTHLRAAYFFENYFPQVESIRGAGSVFLPVSGSKRVAMAAAADIGVAACRRLLDASWSGHTTMGVHGPADLSFDEAALAISEGLGRQVKHVQVDPAAAREALLGMGLGESITDLLLEMYGAIDADRLEVAEPRTAETTTPTTLMAWARDVLRPMIG